MNNKTQDLNLTITQSKGDDSVVVISDLVDRQPVSHQSVGPKYLTKSCLQSKLDQDDVKIIAPKIPSKVCIQRAATQSNTTVRRCTERDLCVYRPKSTEFLSGIGVEYYAWRKAGNPSYPAQYQHNYVRREDYNQVHSC